MKDKLCDAMHYVIARHPPSQLGATKLNKVLWFADCEMYRRHGRSITGEQAYVRKQNGPCSARFESALRSLKDQGVVQEEQVPTFNGYYRRELHARQSPDVTAFSGEEVDILNEIAKEISRLTAQEASDLSHDLLWQETEHNSQMAIAAGAVKVCSLSEADLDWARAAFA